MSLTREEVMRMAREAGMEKRVFSDEYIVSRETLIRLAAMVDAKAEERESEIMTSAAMKSAELAIDMAMTLEREACAMLCEARMNRLDGAVDDRASGYFNMAVRECAHAIRARSNGMGEG